MVGTDRQADVNAATSSAAVASVGIGCVARAGELVASKALAQAVKAGDRLNRGTLALRRLFDSGARGVDLGRGWRRQNRRRPTRPCRTAARSGRAVPRCCRCRRSRA